METKRIVRSRDERLIAGVAGGLAAYLNIDPLYVRLGFIVLALAQGLGLLVYVVLWLLLPNEGSLSNDTRSQVQENISEMQSSAEDLVDRVRSIFNH